MISCKLSGGLGNQLFQIFTTISYAFNNNKPFVFLNNHQLGTGANGSTIRYTYWDHFLSALKPFLKNMNEIPQFSVVREEGFGYSELPLQNNTNIVLVGHFQSPLYFSKHKEMICRLIRLGEKQNIVKKRINMMDLDLDMGLCLDNAVSIHFRLGDYKNYPDKHPILSVLYYINAIQFMIQTKKPIESNAVTEDTLFLYFCEEDDLDEVTLTMTEIQKTFPQLRFQRATNGTKISDWEEMLFMSLCSHNIIANSTFSWWSAYLNNHPNKIVCCPETWFGPQMDCSMADFFPEDWKRISCLKKNERQPTNNHQPTN